MKKQLLHIAQIIGFVILALSFALAFVAAQEQAGGFNGIWQRNDEESDDPQEKMKEAMEAMRSQMGGSKGGSKSGMGGRGGGGMGGPPGGGGGGGGGMEGRRPGGREGMQGGGFAELAQMTAEIETSLKDNEFQVIPSGEGKVRIFYLDGEKHKRETVNGGKLETKCEKKGNRIIVEQKSDQGPEFDTTYEIAPDGTRMIVTVQMEGGRMKEPIIIRTVYDSISDEVSS
jgi:hypothetical protein